MTNYKNAIERIAGRRKNDLIMHEQQVIAALRENPELHEVDTEIRAISARRRKGESVDTAHLDALKLKRAEMLKLLGIAETPPLRCQNCGDTGVVDGKPCACVIAEVAASESTGASFESSDLSVFSPADLPHAQRAYQVMLSFCAKFPHTNIKTVILSGGTGTGKTFLASCVADRLGGRGFSVLFVSAFGFVNRMLGYHTADMGDKLDYLLPLIDCDLLVIDDLGTESRLKNVTVEYLYSVLNERMRLSRHTLITTNFDKEMLAARYGERVFSRLFDKRTSTSIVLADKDLRS